MRFELPPSAGNRCSHSHWLLGLCPVDVTTWGHRQPSSMVDISAARSERTIVRLLRIKHLCQPPGNGYLSHPMVAAVDGCTFPSLQHLSRGGNDAPKRFHILRAKSLSAGFLISSVQGVSGQSQLPFQQGSAGLRPPRMRWVGFTISADMPIDGGRRATCQVPISGAQTELMFRRHGLRSLCQARTIRS
jgi:hypothetical protein